MQITHLFKQSFLFVVTNCYYEQKRLFYIYWGAVFFLLWFAFLFPFPKLKSFSQVVYSSEGTLLTGYLTDDDKWRMYSSLEEVSPQLIDALIEKEDSRFYYHIGVDPFAISRALIQNILGGERVSGASTISMQTARMLTGGYRTYASKVYEMFVAFQLELRFSKKELLELYLSLLPYGGNVEGVKAASLLYFNKSPLHLSAAESVALTIIPNNPNSLRIDRDNDLIRQRNYWIERLENAGVFSEAVTRDAISETFVRTRYSIPNLAPHFTRAVVRFSNETTSQTTLRYSHQLIVERLLGNYVRRASSTGISNGAVLVVDNSTGDVVAYAGSADYYNRENQGENDGVRSIRSPGSALKPFLYANALDRGLITPKLMLNDIPSDFAGFTPDNFDLEFRGKVTASYALVNSLNIPAVTLLNLVGTKEFVRLLSDNGFYVIEKQKASLGLSLILGGCGVTLEQMVRLYTAFPNSGNIKNLRYIKGNNISAKHSVFSPEAAYLTTVMLQKNTRPDFPEEYISRSDLPRIAWKTGTSYGKRDAWAIGYSKQYTIGVWMGNFDGRGAPDLVGVQASVPLLFDLFKAIDQSPGEISVPTSKIKEREICMESGMVAGPLCSKREKDFFIPGVSSGKICDLHSTIYVANNNSESYCRECLPDSGYTAQVINKYEPELSMWYSSRGVTENNIPPHSKNCITKKGGAGPKIISPTANFEYLLELGKDQQIMLQAAASHDIQILYWFADNTYLGKSVPGEKIFYTVKHNATLITCRDDKGRESSVRLKAVFY